MNLYMQSVVWEDHKYRNTGGGGHLAGMIKRRGNVRATGHITSLAVRRCLPDKIEVLLLLYNERDGEFGIFFSFLVRTWCVCEKSDLLFSERVFPSKKNTRDGVTLSVRAFLIMHVYAQRNLLHLEKAALEYDGIPGHQEKGLLGRKKEGLD